MLSSPSYAKSVAHYADLIPDCLLLHFTAGVLQQPIGWTAGKSRSWVVTMQSCTSSSTAWKTLCSLRHWCTAAKGRCQDTHLCRSCQAYLAAPFPGLSAGIKGNLCTSESSVSNTGTQTHAERVPLSSLNTRPVHRKSSWAITYKAHGIAVQIS